MRLVIYEDARFDQLHPLTYFRPSFELRCGKTTLRQKIERSVGRKADVVFLRDLLRDLYAAGHPRVKINELDALRGDDLLIVNGRCLLIGDAALPTGRDVCGMAEDQIAYVALTKDKADHISAASFEEFLAEAAKAAPQGKAEVPLINYPWELFLNNGKAVADDFEKIGKCGIEGDVHETVTVWGPKDRLYVAPGAVVCPGVVIDTNLGPVSIGENALVEPTVRVQGPTAIGAGSKCLVGSNIHEGTTLGPVSWVSGEIEETIIHGYSNKMHYGFLGHAYVCEWVNLGAGTTNSDVKNDFQNVEVYVNGQLTNTGSFKCGCFVGDHSKTSIDTMLNTGTVVGVMSNILGIGSLLPKYVPSGVMFIEGKFYKQGIQQILTTARTHMGRRQKTLSPEEESLMTVLYDLTKSERSAYVKKSRADLMIQKGLRS